MTQDERLFMEQKLIDSIESIDLIDSIEPKHSIEITHDLTSIKVICYEMIDALNAGPKSRERSLVITKLQEATMWANQAQATDV